MLWSVQTPNWRIYNSSKIFKLIAINNFLALSSIYRKNNYGNQPNKYERKSFHHDEEGILGADKGWSYVHT
jgi:hypothetical protein